MTAYEFSVPFNGDPGTLDALLVFKGQGGVLEINGMSQIHLIFKNFGNRCLLPVAWLGRIKAGDFNSVFLVVKVGRNRNLFLFKLICNLAGAFAAHTQRENPLYNGCGFLVDNNFSLRIGRVFLIPEGWS